MANITPYLNQIQSAIYGREVRGNIVNALNAMNTDINVDLTTIQGYVNSAQRYAEVTQTLSSYVSEAVDRADQDAESANQAKEDAFMASNYAESAQRQIEKDMKKVQGYASAAQEIVENFYSIENQNKVYETLRKYVNREEGFIITEGALLDSNGEEILDSSGNAIDDSHRLDPLIFKDQFLYTLYAMDQNPIFYDKVFQYVFAQLVEKTALSVLSNLLMNVFDYERFFNETTSRMGTYEMEFELLDSDGNQILDSSDNPIESHVIFYTKL